MNRGGRGSGRPLAVEAHRFTSPPKNGQRGKITIDHLSDVATLWGMKKRMNVSRLVERGIYELRIGGSFYVGSSGDVRKRCADHAWRLRKGIHSNERLQAAWDCSPESHEVVYLGDPGGAWGCLRDAEQARIDVRKYDVGFCNKSLSARSPSGQSAVMKRKWQDPEFRAKMLYVSRNRGFTSEETRELQAAAKVGGRNPRSKRVWLRTPGGYNFEFETTVDAAVHLRVSQQLVSSWCCGRAPLPGSGSYTRREDLVGIEIGYL